MSFPHPDSANSSVQCAVITVSDTRTIATDRSGQLIQQLLNAAGHRLSAYVIVRDEPEQILTQMEQLSQVAEALIFSGGTGIAPRDTTYDAIELLLEKTLPGFGELFRALSYEEIGSRAIASRAVAGVFRAGWCFQCRVLRMRCVWQWRS